MAEYPENEITKNNNGISWRRQLKYAVFAFLVVFAVYSVIIYVYASKNTAFAERYTVTTSAFFRQMLARITSFLPFSVAETLVVICVPIFLFSLIRAVVLRFYYKQKGRVKSFLMRFICLILAAFSIFINTFGVCYKRQQLSYLLGIDTENISEEDVFTSAYLCTVVSSHLSDDIKRDSEGGSVMPYSFDEMVLRIHKGYRNVLLNVPDVMSVKPVALSVPWTYTRISGMYFPFTGESNINVNYPDFVMAFTTAHEMAHQLGFASEDEANMMAFLALHYSEDSYLIYCAFMNALDYLISDMDAQTVATLGNATDRRILDEFSAYYSFISKYRNKTVSEISSGINDAYLKANGVENGTKSYNDVTKLLCAFMKTVYRGYYS